MFSLSPLASPGPEIPNPRELRDAAIVHDRSLEESLALWNNSLALIGELESLARSAPDPSEFIALRERVIAEAMQVHLELHQKLPGFRPKSDRYFEIPNSLFEGINTYPLSLPEGKSLPSASFLRNGLAAPAAVPLLYCSDLGAFAAALSAEERRLFEGWYESPLVPGRISLRTDASELLKKPVEAAAIWQALRRVTSAHHTEISGDSQILFPPVHCGPLVAYLTKSGTVLEGNFDSIRMPYGCLSVTRSYLTQLQDRQLHQKKLFSCVLNLAGRVSSDFLHWALGEGEQSPSPLPHVAIVYNFPLPSGRTYRFTIKPGPGVDIGEHPMKDSLTRADWKVIRGLRDYFKSSRNRKSLAIFDPPLKTAGPSSAPTLINSTRELVEFVHRWEHAVHQDLTASPRDLRGQSYQRWPWLTTNVLTESAVEKMLLERIGSLPYDQAVYAPSELELTEAAAYEVSQQAAPLIYRIMQEERSRISQEALSDAHRVRERSGYKGPPAGYPLPLDYIVMDLVKNRKAYEAEAGRRKVSVAELDPPLYFGRRYDKPVRFHGVSTLSKKLAEVSSVRSFRRIKVTLKDPLAEGGIVDYPSDRIVELESFLLQVSLDRLHPILSRLRSPGLGLSPIFEVPSDEREQFWQVYDELTARIGVLENGLIQSKQLRGEALKTLNSSLAAVNTPRTEYISAMREASEHQAALVKAAQDDLDDQRANLLAHLEDHIPAITRENAVSLHEIRDQELIVAIYAIGANGKPRLYVEGAGFRHFHSELLGGKNMYAGGELVFSRHSDVFTNLPDWEAFNDKVLRTPDALWILTELNNASGHYEPGPGTLAYAKAVMFPLLRRHGISCRRCKVVDRLTPGFHLGSGRTGQT